MMIRTQIYLPKNLHFELYQLAKRRARSMAELVRAFIEHGLKEQKKQLSGIDTMQSLAHLRVKGGPKDLSKNLDRYLYGAKE